MKRNVKFAILGCAVFLSLFFAAVGWYIVKATPVGSGYTAKYLCSNVFVSGRDPDPVFREEIVPINPLARFIDYRIDPEKKSVTADAYGGFFARTAIYREGYGCTLVVGVGEAELRAQKLIPPERLQAKVVLDEPDYYRFLYAELFDPLGMRNVVFEPDAPTDAYAAQGFQEQMVIVIPSRKAVLVRLGAAAPREAWSTNAFIRDVLAALP
ncbi:MAG: hypothetical protein HZB24_12065 [Desulfobacterales bacterium]|nr:hypothetical protein [Desulfobacterales bacterium]